MGVPTKFFREIGTTAFLRIYWGRGCGHPDNFHNAMLHLMDSPALDDWKLGGELEEYAAERWPTSCEDCGAAVPPIPDRIPCDCGTPGCTKIPDGAPQRQVFRNRLFQAADGTYGRRNEFPPGALRIVRWHDAGESCHHGWTNCDGNHLVCTTPDGHEWDIDGRASNCTLREENTHRCWVRHGDPEHELVHVDKSGKTCSAGAGSIQTPNYHGFLHNGVLV